MDESYRASVFIDPVSWSFNEDENSIRFLGTSLVHKSGTSSQRIFWKNEEVFVTHVILCLSLSDYTVHIDGSEQECFNCKKVDSRKSHKKIDKTMINREVPRPIEY